MATGNSFQFVFHVARFLPVDFASSFTAVLAVLIRLAKRGTLIIILHTETPFNLFSKIIIWKKKAKVTIHFGKKVVFPFCCGYNKESSGKYKGKIWSDFDMDQRQKTETKKNDTSEENGGKRRVRLF
ncbi:MAG: hypothetical protein ACLUUO_18095 [Sellimonas intestinalis]